MRPGLNSLKFLRSFLQILSNSAFCIENDELGVFADRFYGDLFSHDPTVIYDVATILVFNPYKPLFRGGVPYLLQDIDKYFTGGEIDLLVFAVYLHSAGRADGVSNRDVEELLLEFGVGEVFLDVDAGGIVEGT